MPCRRWASENPREDSRATVRCGHRPRIRREPWSIVDSKTPASSRRFISLSVASLRTYYVPVSWKAVHHSRRWHRARAIRWRHFLTYWHQPRNQNRIFRS
jgi:hypothetical protein